MSMSDERLDDLQERREWLRVFWKDEWVGEDEERVIIAVDEIVRLRAENERLTRQLDRCDCEKCFRCGDVIPEGNAIFYDGNGDPFCARCWGSANPEPTT